MRLHGGMCPETFQLDKIQNGQFAVRQYSSDLHDLFAEHPMMDYPG